MAKRLLMTEEDARDYIFAEMFNRVGITYSLEAIMEHQYYLKHEWTQDEEDDYKNWLTNELYTNTALRNAFRLSKNKTTINNEAYWFVWNYGWKTKIK